jgi:hypothetical protein
MRIADSLARLALGVRPAAAAAHHTQAGPGRVAGIAPPPPPPRADHGYGQHYGHQSRGTVIVTPDGTVIVTGGHGYERGRNCVIENGYGYAPAYGSNYVQPAYPTQQTGVTQPRVYQPQPGVAQPMPYTPPVPNQQTASQQLAANPNGQPQPISRACW